jgi:hypothetical protein
MAADLKVPGSLRRDKRSTSNAVSTDPVPILMRRDTRHFQRIDADTVIERTAKDKDQTEPDHASLKQGRMERAPQTERARVET